MAGNSWLAASQWLVAAERPPHLACIAPFEGHSDHLRETLCRGGIPSTMFSKMIKSTLAGRGQQEDDVAMLERDPNCREYWDDKRARIDRIQVPAYILGSFSTLLHTIGSFRGFEEIPHQAKWIAVHATQEWYDLYSKARTDDLHKFFDRYLKGIQNDWEKTPPVRLSILRYNKPAILDMPLDKLPWHEPFAPGTTLQRLYLSHDKTMKPLNDGNPTTLEYKGVDLLEFAHTFQESTALVGPTKLVIHTACPSQNDFDIYAQIRKRGSDGSELQHINIPLEALGVSSAEEVPHINPLRYLGPTGQLRASKRKLAPELRQKYWDTLSHDAEEPVIAGEIVRLEVWLWPTAIHFDAGEQLVLKVSGHSMSLPEFEMLLAEPEQAPAQIVHVGGDYDSYLEGVWLSQ
ncbi:hypothetical protein DHEL01_v209789 [Diaporthe helianthi]|uniref:Xaa-Pro dipeptidyl-peptidase C-terminal domain-containing protein n=1 Tax=Diaporthe helianthi TaxID=158607 RepID=A0A2P5HNI9_DIAHE|nr:hypothetical protein DHEL01_v209789 [Diaporthe helianthi]